MAVDPVMAGAGVIDLPGMPFSSDQTVLGNISGVTAFPYAIPRSSLASATVTAKTSNYTILAADNGTTFTNAGAVGTVIFALPVPVAGYQFQFAVLAAQVLTVDATAGVTIALGAAVSSSGGTMSADGAAGGLQAFLSLVAVSTTQWVAEFSFGPWTPA